jgi:hypothetical protein
MDAPEIWDWICNSKWDWTLNHFNIISKFDELSMTPKISIKAKVLRSMILKEMILTNIGTYAINNMVTIHFFLEKILTFFSNSQL